MKNTCPIPAQPAAPAAAQTSIAANTVVLYDAKTGAIAHVHQVTTFPGGTHPSAQDMEFAAGVAFSDLARGSFGNLAALHLNGRISDHLCPGKTYKVIDCALVQG